MSVSHIFLLRPSFLKCCKLLGRRNGCLLFPLVKCFKFWRKDCLCHQWMNCTTQYRVEIFVHYWTFRICSVILIDNKSNDDLLDWQLSSLFCYSLFTQYPYKKLPMSILQNVHGHVTNPWGANLEEFRRCCTSLNLGQSFLSRHNMHKSLLCVCRWIWFHKDQDWRTGPPGFPDGLW